MVRHSIKSVLGFGLATLLLINLSACSGTPISLLEVSTKPIEKPELTLPPVDVVNMRKIDWIIITEKNFEEIVAKSKKDGIPVSFFSLSGDGYANLGLNFSDIRALVQQQQAIIAAYDEYYKGIDEQIDEANKTIEDSSLF